MPSDDSDGSAGLVERDREVRHAFSPSAPIKRRDLFAGRTQQLMSVSEALAEPGQHVVIYGERGVGKTSLATVCAGALARASGIYAVKINCQSGDNFGSIWRKVFNEISIVSKVSGFGFSGKAEEVVTKASGGLRVSSKRGAEIMDRVFPRDSRDA
ncbi:MAG: putative DNA-binding protein [Actinomycetia bacterium]|nr:putative DNA-binding protein [Actinomycetes bacterium]